MNQNGIASLFSENSYDQVIFEYGWGVYMVEPESRYEWILDYMYEESYKETFIQQDYDDQKLIRSVDILNEIRRIGDEEHFRFLIRIDADVYSRICSIEPENRDRLKKVILVSENGNDEIVLNVVNDFMTTMPRFVPETDEENEYTGCYILDFYASIERKEDEKAEV